jgi:hypothetical protein
MTNEEIRTALMAALLHSGHPPSERLVKLLVDRAIATLDANDPTSTEIIAEVAAWKKAKGEDDRRDTLLAELWDDRPNADLIFIRRNPKITRIYERYWFWWASRQILLSHPALDDDTWRYGVAESFEFYPPELVAAPKHVYLDKMVYDIQRKRFHVEEIANVKEWWKQHVEQDIFRHNLLNSLDIRAIQFAESLALEIKSLASSVQEFYIPGHEDVRTFKVKSA